MSFAPAAGNIVMNGMDFPEYVPLDCILSAYPGSNPIDPEKVYAYARMLEYNGTPPAIMGYPSYIDEGDVDGYFMNGEQITEDHVGMAIFYVTDGHHRVLAAFEAGVEIAYTIPDRSAFTNAMELKEFDFVSAGKNGRR